MPIGLGQERVTDLHKGEWRNMPWTTELKHVSNIRTLGEFDDRALLPSLGKEAFFGSETLGFDLTKRIFDYDWTLPCSAILKR
jgi:hypothetical protein